MMVVLSQFVKNGVWTVSSYLLPSCFRCWVWELLLGNLNVSWKEVLKMEHPRDVTEILPSGGDKKHSSNRLLTLFHKLMSSQIMTTHKWRNEDDKRDQENYGRRYIAVSATCVRIPVLLSAHSESVYIENSGTTDEVKAKRLQNFQVQSWRWCCSPNLSSSSQCCRFTWWLLDGFVEHLMLMRITWVVSDNLLKGAAELSPNRRNPSWTWTCTTNTLNWSLNWNRSKQKSVTRRALLLLS